MPNQYAQSVDGTVIVTAADGSALVLKLPPAAEHELTSLVLDPWRPIIEAESARTGVPEAALAAAIYQESRGNAYLIGTDPDGGHGYGLTMLTSHGIFQGHDPSEFTAAKGDAPDVVQAKAHLNLALGADFMRTVYKVLGEDFPKVVSGYNAGFDYKNRTPWPMAKSAWGYRETINSKGVSTIDQYVKAFNTAIELGLSGNLSAGTGEKYAAPPVAVTTVATADGRYGGPVLVVTAGLGALAGAVLTKKDRVKGAGIGAGIGVGAYLLGRYLSS